MLFGVSTTHLCPSARLYLCANSCVFILHGGLYTFPLLVQKLSSNINSGGEERHTWDSRHPLALCCSWPCAVAVEKCLSPLACGLHTPLHPIYHKMCFEFFLYLVRVWLLQLVHQTESLHLDADILGGS